MLNLIEIGKKAKVAARQLAVFTTDQKNNALLAIADELEKQSSEVLKQNNLDILDGEKNGLSKSILDRLLLTEKRIKSMADDVRKVAKLPDPVGKNISDTKMYNGIQLIKRRVPIGVLGVIYEARPNVTIDVATLCLKTGNAVILRGGKETFRSNVALVKIIQTALEKTNFPKTAVQYIDNPDRKYVTELLQLDKYVDMIIPRGGAGLHKLCRERSFIPVITGGIGICHVFVDETADLLRAVDIVENSKVQRPSVCNALDTLLVHKNVAEKFLPEIAKRLAKSEVELRAEEKAFEILKKSSSEANVVSAGPDDFDKEWLALILSVKVVDGIDEAIAHIHEHSSEHTDSILTQNNDNAEKFIKEINSASVYVNASTRFTDGGEFGLGAEVAVSTQKLHARGPMGLEELTTYKWIGLGDGQIRE